MAKHSTRMLYLIKLIEVVDGLGSPIDDILHSAGLTSIDLGEPDRRLAIDDYVAAIETATAVCQIPDLGFRVGARTELVEHGVLGYALLSAATLRASLERYVRYQFLQGPLLSVELNVTENTAALIARPVLKHIGDRTHVLQYIVQEWLVGWNQLSPLIGAHGIFFNDVSSSLVDSRLADSYAQYLGCSISRANDFTTATFPGEYLERPLDFADQAVTKLCDEQCKRILEQLDLGHGLVAELHRLLAATPGSVPNMDTAADRLFMNARTLRRRLLAEGTTYQQVVAEFRLAMAKRYLTETTLPANEIANLVGYADPANLYRIFLEAMNMTPQHFRLHAGAVER